MSNKIVLSDVTSGFKLSVINDNFQKIEDELNDKVAYRVNPVGTPNQMAQTLDMNGHSIINCPSIDGSGGEGGGDSDPTKADLNGNPLEPFQTLTQPVNTNNNYAATTAFVLAQKATSLPSPIGLFPAIGSSTRFALEDHVHVDPTGGGGTVTSINNAQLYAYQRSATTLLSSPGDVTYDFTTGKITSPVGDALANGWTKSIPAGTNPLYVCVASGSNTTATDNVAAAEWTTPVILASNGVAGLNVATIYLYQRAVTPLAPNLPTSTSTYDFSTKTLSGYNNGWSPTVPSSTGGNYLYVTTATAASTTSTDTIPNTEWAAAQLMASNGTNGTNGTNGSNGATGTRGTVQIAYAIAGTSWSNTEANNALIAAGYYPPINRDIVTLYNTGAGFSETRFYDSGSWLVLGAYINGNMLVTGTLSANKVTGGTLAGVVFLGGSGHTPSGAAFEINSSGACWADNIFGGYASFNNNYLNTTSAVEGFTYGTGPGSAGFVNAANSNIGAHGVRGKNYYNTASGLVGAGNGYDFYADGAGTNYGPFTGAHDSLVMPDCPAVPGDIVVDVECISRSNMSNTIFKVVPSTVVCQKAVVGVFVQSRPFVEGDVPAGFIKSRDMDAVETTDSYATAQATYHIASINALGEGQINVCDEGGDIEAGDFIVTSSIPGKGMRQSDDVLHNYTVAKARESVTFTPGEQKTIACIYLCG